MQNDKYGFADPSNFKTLKLKIEAGKKFINSYFTGNYDPKLIKLWNHEIEVAIRAAVFSGIKISFTAQQQRYFSIRDYFDQNFIIFLIINGIIYDSCTIEPVNVR